MASGSRSSRPGTWCGRSRTLAENIVESLVKGDRVFVHGTVTTETWTDKQTGEKRTAQRVLAEIVGPSLRWATARITKTTRASAANEDPQHVGEHEARSKARSDRGKGARRGARRAPSTRRR